MLIHSLFLQVIVSVAWVLVSPQGTIRIMKSETEKYVELSCKRNPKAFLSSLAYNVLLVVMCAYYAIKTRKLPDNFNESRFISLCVYTTVIMWVAFFPTYYTASSAIYKTICLSLALILNATACLTGFFLPKIYALFFLGDKDLHVHATMTIAPATKTTATPQNTIHAKVSQRTSSVSS